MLWPIIVSSCKCDYTYSHRSHSHVEHTVCALATWVKYCYCCDYIHTQRTLDATPGEGTLTVAVVVVAATAMTMTKKKIWYKTTHTKSTMIKY